MAADNSSVSVYLIGPMGSGKSAVGRRLARDLGRQFADSDDEIEARTGVDVPYIFEKEGEDGFRRREQEVIAELTAIPALILATGGGSILARQNRRALAAGGQVVYLHTSVDQQLKRTRRGRERPLLKKGDPRATLEALMAEREPLYREIADLVVDTNGRRVASVAREIRDKLNL